MIIYDVYEHSTDEVIPNFWMFHEEITKPISAIATANAYRILGISISAANKSSVVHYYERNDQKSVVMSELDRRAIDPLSKRL